MSGGVKTKNTHVIVERIVTDIDSIVKQTRFVRMKATAKGEGTVSRPFLAHP